MSNSATTNLKRISLELGGKLPNIIFHDANLELLNKQAVASAYSAPQGQSCSVGFYNIIQITQKSAHLFMQVYMMNFVKNSADCTKKIVKGYPLSDLTNHGSLVAKIQFDKVHNYLQISKNEAASLQLGEDKLPGKGYFIQPYIFSHTTDDMTIAREEILERVMSVLKFQIYEEVIKRANDSQYGLVAGIITQSIDLYNTLAKKLELELYMLIHMIQLTLIHPMDDIKARVRNRVKQKQSPRLFGSKTHIVIVALTSKF